VEHHAERHGEDHRGEQRLLLGHAPLGTPRSTTRRANTTEARPRGPNQPMKATVGRRTPMPAVAIATGSMRTSVRLSAA